MSFINAALFVMLAQYAIGQSIFDPQVFNAYFYINSNSLMQNGVYSVAQAQAHWEAYGMIAGLQASGNFHSRQYIERYPDLQKAFGTDWPKGVVHYLTHGIAEGRLGYLEGGAYGRYTVSSGVNTGIFVSGSDRTAGAVDSVWWNGTEFINQWDHGRELQFAITTNNHGECYNPTEAGRSDDASQQSTTSQLLGVKAAANVLETTVMPAFWLAPGEKEPNPGPGCQVALNTVAVSAYRSSKRVTIGAQGIWNAIEYDFEVLVPEDLQWIQIESPTAYMTGDFSVFYTINTTSQVVAPISQGPGEQPLPLIFTNTDGSRAMGAFIAQHPPTHVTIGNGRWYFQEAVVSDTTSKWTMVFRNGPYPSGTELGFTSYVCVGTTQDVVSCMIKLASLTDRTAAKHQQQQSEEAQH